MVGIPGIRDGMVNLLTESRLLGIPMIRKPFAVPEENGADHNKRNCAAGSRELKQMSLVLDLCSIHNGYSLLLICKRGKYIYVRPCAIIK